tara:strand:+ start:782 stop:955 length:174 start_codon:yes stop_codon:yes gene_type:complete
MEYKVTTCLNPMSGFVEQQIELEATKGWFFISHSNYIDKATGFWNVTLVYGLDNKDS